MGLSGNNRREDSGASTLPRSDSQRESIDEEIEDDRSINQAQ